jgi:hypothetical protein
MTDDRFTLRLGQVRQWLDRGATEHALAELESMLAERHTPQDVGLRVELLITRRSSGGQPVDAPLNDFMRAVGTRHVYQKYQKPEDLLRIVHEHLQQALERMIQLLLNLGKSAKGGLPSRAEFSRRRVRRGARTSDDARAERAIDRLRA